MSPVELGRRIQSWAARGTQVAATVERVPVPGSLTAATGATGQVIEQLCLLDSQADTTDSPPSAR
jgi:hypothetical protein